MLNCIGVKGVMFDCYKTLVDIKTDEKSINAYEPVSKWLMYHGVNINSQDLMNEYRWRCKEAIERRREMHSEIKVEEIFAKICKHHSSWDINEETVGIVSNGQRVFSELEVRHLGLQNYFKFILFSSDFGRKKPCSEIFLAGADLLGLRPEDILFIGDSFENDISPSRGLGMKAMHIEDAWKFFKVA